MVRGLRLPRRTVALPRAVEKLWRRRLACSELSLQAGRVFQEGVPRAPLARPRIRHDRCGSSKTGCGDCSPTHSSQWFFVTL